MGTWGDTLVHLANGLMDCISVPFPILNKRGQDGKEIYGYGAVR